MFDALCPIIHSLGPGVSPGVSASTINPVNALLAGVPASAVLARTKYLYVCVGISMCLCVRIAYEVFHMCTCNL